MEHIKTHSMSITAINLRMLSRRNNGFSIVKNHAENVNRGVGDKQIVMSRLTAIYVTLSSLLVTDNYKHISKTSMNHLFAVQQPAVSDS
jgi:hypothetical protein